MDASLVRGLTDKIYEKRKAAALDIERIVKHAAGEGDHKRIGAIIAQLCEFTRSTISTSRNGGLMGLAGAAIALGADCAPYLSSMIPPVLACFSDADNRVRYFACESMYNIAKVAKGEMLPYFNELFDVLSRLCADTELPVKNGAELLDRLIKDIVTEQASTYVSKVAEPPADPKAPVLQRGDDQPSTVLAAEAPLTQFGDPGSPRAFSLTRFVPLLSERIYVINPFTRSFLVSWLSTLDSVPELELVTYLPSFLDGLLRYLSDANQEIKNATVDVLKDFLDSVRTAAEVQRAREEAAANRQARKENDLARSPPRTNGDAPALDPVTSTPPPKSDGPQEAGDTPFEPVDETTHGDVEEPEQEDEGIGLGTWVPGQGVVVDHAAIVEILLVHLRSYERDTDVHRTCLQWITEFLQFAEPVMIPFVPRIISVVLPTLALDVDKLREAATMANTTLANVVYNLPVSSAATRALRSRTSSEESLIKPPSPNHAVAFPSLRQPPALDGLALEFAGQPAPTPVTTEPGDEDVLDYSATVAALMEQLVPDQEETRLACLKWLVMLHQKAPRKVMSMHDGTFPALLKLLSEQSISEDVIKADLQLITQISSASEDEYFTSFIRSLLNLFRSDTALLEKRGSLIVRQLCVHLKTERIYRTFAEILEHDEELEFASVMVQNLNLIVITTSELADFRRKLKNLDTKDGQSLFTILYRSWSHNAVAAFSLCLLAQAYEHASNLLQIFADLEITVSLLIQVDKLVQLLESPVFTSLRLQLLEPDRHPYLFKALYGLLMLLPQSSAFATLRNRLNAVSTLGFMSVMPRPGAPTPASSGAAGVAGARSTLRRTDDSIKWQDLLAHFRSVQLRHEKSRRLTPSQGFYDNDSAPASATGYNSPTVSGPTTSTLRGNAPAKRRTGGSSVASSERKTRESARQPRGPGGSPSVSLNRPLSPNASSGKRLVSASVPRR